MILIRKLSSILCFALLGVGCSTNDPHQRMIEAVTYEKFEQFVHETGYLTDAERYGWSFVQQDVYRYIKVYGATWRNPDGLHPPASKKLPVTQVSYNDAMAYCNWSGTKLPTYDQYWELIKDDERMVVKSLNREVENAEDINLLGYVWEITASEERKDTRLAGGSFFCSTTTCNGLSKERELYIDKQSGNLHVGFAVISKKSAKSVKR